MFKLALDCVRKTYITNMFFLRNQTPGLKYISMTCFDSMRILKRNEIKKNQNEYELSMRNSRNQ